MNSCYFYGEVIDVVVVEEEVKKAVLTIRISTKRKLKSGKVVTDYNDLKFEAWDSAAEVLQNTKGAELIVRSTARNTDQGIVFRINEFVPVR